MKLKSNNCRMSMEAGKANAGRAVGSVRQGPCAGPPGSPRRAGTSRTAGLNKATLHGDSPRLPHGTRPETQRNTKPITSPHRTSNRETAQSHSLAKAPSTHAGQGCTRPSTQPQTL